MQDSTKELISPNLFLDSELVFGLVGAVGTDLKFISDTIKLKLKFFRYTTIEINVSELILKPFLNSAGKKAISEDEYNRIDTYMKIGDDLRKESEGIIGMAVADYIHTYRINNSVTKNTSEPISRVAYIIKSFKHKQEVNVLRSIYGNGFYLIGTYTDEDMRFNNLKERSITAEHAKELIKRDEAEQEGYGQQTRDTFQMSDFFIDYGGDLEKTKKNISRIVDLIFGHPFHTPTFGEYAMFMAYCASMRSADLSRQIGAVICKGDEIIATGVNDCPKFGGGLYWPSYDKKTQCFCDVENGRDYMRKCDSNKLEISFIANDILTKLNLPITEENINIIYKSRMKDLTEYGRVVHAEMEALSMCARNNMSCRGGELYATTFPCHNCAKHIIASGISKVVYIEPYPKSKAFTFYSDSISKNEIDKGKKVIFIPFFGVGPRRFIELFSTSLSPLANKERKDSTGINMKEWVDKESNVRSQMLPTNYFEREIQFSNRFNWIKKKRIDDI